LARVPRSSAQPPAPTTAKLASIFSKRRRLGIRLPHETVNDRFASKWVSFSDEKQSGGFLPRARNFLFRALDNSIGEMLNAASE
jgi:hypothetical protein